MTEFEEFDEEIAKLKENARKTHSCEGCENFYRCWMMCWGETFRNDCVDYNKYEPNPTIRSIIGMEIYLKHAGDHIEKKKNIIHSDCYYYYDDHDIPCCKLEKEYGKVPCENCSNYVTKKEADKIIWEFKNGNYIKRP